MRTHLIGSPSVSVGDDGDGGVQAADHLSRLDEVIQSRNREIGLAHSRSCGSSTARNDILGEANLRI